MARRGTCYLAVYRRIFEIQRSAFAGSRIGHHQLPRRAISRHGRRPDRPAPGFRQRRISWIFSLGSRVKRSGFAGSPRSGNDSEASGRPRCGWNHSVNPPECPTYAGNLRFLPRTRMSPVLPWRKVSTGKSRFASAREVLEAYRTLSNRLARRRTDPVGQSLDRLSHFLGCAKFPSRKPGGLARSSVGLRALVDTDDRCTPTGALRSAAWALSQTRSTHSCQREYHAAPLP